MKELYDFLMSRFCTNVMMMQILYDLDINDQGRLCSYAYFCDDDSAGKVIIMEDSHKIEELLKEIRLYPDFKIELGHIGTNFIVIDDSSVCFEDEYYMINVFAQCRNAGIEHILTDVIYRVEDFKRLAYSYNLADKSLRCLGSEMNMVVVDYSNSTIHIYEKNSEMFSTLLGQKEDRMQNEEGKK